MSDPVLGQYLRPAYKYIKNKLGEDLIGVLIGAYNGKSANYVFSAIRMKKFFLIEPCSEYGDGTYDQMSWNLAFDNLQSTFSGVGDVVIIKDKAENVCNDFENSTLDFVYIDGDHSYEHVLLDMNLWWPKVRNGGVMAGHDFNLKRVSPNGYYEDVERAVREFCQKQNIKLNTEPCGFNGIPDWWIDKNGA
jgi:hypothetical protein